MLAPGRSREWGPVTMCDMVWDSLRVPVVGMALLLLCSVVVW